VGLCESTADTGEHCVDGAARDACLEELLHELDRVTARETVADRQRRDRRLKPWPEMASSDLAGEQPRAASAAARAAHTLAAMLDDTDRDHGQLFDLMARGLAHRQPARLAEHMAAVAAPRPVIDELIDRPRGKQRPAVTLMPRLAARFASRTILPAPRRAPRGIRARRPRRVLRVLGQLTLELLHPRLELHDTPVHRQKDFDYSLAPRVIDRFRLNALHAQIFDGAQLCPPTH
jgi:hypothetical protein